MIHNGYVAPRITRSPTLNMYDDIRAGEKALTSFGKKYVIPAAKTAGKELLKVPVKTLPTIGQGLGLAAGVGASVAAANPELLPYLGTAGGYAGKKLGQYAQGKIERAIDKL